MRIVIFGAGAIGGYIGAVLSSKHDVLLIVRPAIADAIAARGLRIRGVTQMTAHPRVATEVKGRLDVDLVIITTKSYDTEQAVAALEPLRTAAPFLTLQNGLGNAEAIGAKILKVFAGTTSHGVTTVAPGELLHAGSGETVIGPFRGVGRPEAAAVAEAFTAAGLQTRTSDDITMELWRKAVLNSAINPICALVRRPNGALLELQDLTSLAFEVLEESCAVAAAEGHPLAPAAMEEAWRAVVEATTANRNSMLQDLERGRRTEVEAITGAIVAAARRRGVATPANTALLKLVRSAESQAGGHAAVSGGLGGVQPS